MPGGRPPGPLRTYTVSCAWPSDPDRWRATVVEVDEKTARDSVGALLQMHFAVQIVMAFRSSARHSQYLGHCVAARWDRFGNVSEQYIGQFREYIPGWVTGREPVEREKNSEPVLSGS